jgi:hypothetical protein
VLRAVARLALLGVVIAGLTQSVTAAPALGGRLSPVPLVYERQPWVQVTNLSTMPVAVTLEALDGWTLAESELQLAVGEVYRVDVTAAGPDDATIRATIVPREALTAPDVNALVLETTARHERPWEAVDVPWWPFLLLTALVASWAVLRRRTSRR